MSSNDTVKTTRGKTGGPSRGGSSSNCSACGNRGLAARQGEGWKLRSPELALQVVVRISCSAKTVPVEGGLRGRCLSTIGRWYQFCLQKAIVKCCCLTHPEFWWLWTEIVKPPTRGQETLPTNHASDEKGFADPFEAWRYFFAYKYFVYIHTIKCKSTFYLHMPWTPWAFRVARGGLVNGFPDPDGLKSQTPPLHPLCWEAEF